MFIEIFIFYKGFKILKNLKILKEKNSFSDKGRRKKETKQTYAVKICVRAHVLLNIYITFAAMGTKLFIYKDEQTNIIYQKV